MDRVGGSARASEQVHPRGECVGSAWVNLAPASRGQNHPPYDTSGPKGRQECSRG